MHRSTPICLLIAWLMPIAAWAQGIVPVRDDHGLRTALANVRPGTRIAIAPGHYRGGLWAENLQGTPQQPIVIEGLDPQHPPLFEGRNEALHVAGAAYLTLRNLAAHAQADNGFNIDDGGHSDRPTHHLTLENLQVSDTGPQGNHDGIKLSGIDDFVVRDCTVHGWGGQSLDMVGCHRGRIENCTFRGKPGFSLTTGPQMKGGCSQITIHRCQFYQAGARAANLGGSTGLQFFRPQGALYEARDLTVEGCLFVSSETPVAFVGVDGAVVRYNTIYQPEKWVLRILQETTAPGFIACRNGRFEHNLVVFSSSKVHVFANVGPHTQPETFQFSSNLWYCEDRPTVSKPKLPVAESQGLYGVNPQLPDPAKGRFTPGNPQAAAYGATALPREESEPRSGRKS